jgi:serine/threonine protein kinase
MLIVSHELAVGSLVKNKYKIVRTLGQGGMGVVYLAEHMMLGGHVALKFLVAGLSHNPQFIKRFRNEAQAAFSLRHPNIVQVLDLDQTEDGSLFIAMEYVAGNSLRGALDEERSGFGVPRALEMARGMVSGLAAAHAQHIVHRDVKPENVLLARAADGREHPKVLDFGIAAMAKSSTQSNMTRGRLLTAEYAAPEQWMEMPAAEMDGRTDLYATGCVFYEMLTGRTPFHAHNMDGWSYQHQMETPRLPSELRPELANWPGLDGLVLRMLAKNRNDRPQDAEVLSLLDSVQSGSVQKRPETAAGYAPKRSQTIIEESWERQPTVVPVPQPVLPQEKHGEHKFPLWAWGALAVLALAAGLSMAWLYAPKSHPANTISTYTPPVVIPPSKTDTNTGTTTPDKPTDLKEPAPVSNKPEPNKNDKSTVDKPASPQDKKSSQADNSKPAVVQPPVVQPPVVPPPIIKPPTPQPSLSDITQQALALYGQKNFSMAAPLLDKACTGGNGEACKDLGNLYHDGIGVGKDGSHAASLYAKACSSSPPTGCNTLGVMYRNGDGVAQSDSRAADLYTQACNANDALGCSNLGSMYWFGRGVSNDDVRAAALYSKACDAGNGAGCSSLATCYSNGRGVPKDPAKAKQLLIKGCGMGNKWGCDQLKVLK